MIRKKLRSSRGDTITEAMISVLVVAITAAMLATMVTTAVKMVDAAQQRTDKLYLEIDSIEERTLAPVSGTISIGSSSIDVDYYSTPGGLTAYEGRG